MPDSRQRTVAIVQARLGSSRLPMKSLLALRGLPIIDWVAERLARATLLDEIVFAVPDTALDDVLAAHLEAAGRHVIRGSEQDVLGRFILAAAASRADAVVRVCADNPLIHGSAVDELIGFYRRERPDYAYNHIPHGNLWPDGLGAEIIGRDILEELGRRADIPSQREHALNYIWDNPQDFRTATFDPADSQIRRPDLKLDVDTPQDFARLALAPVNVNTSPRALAAIFPAGEAGASAL